MNKRRKKGNSMQNKIACLVLHLFFMSSLIYGQTSSRVENRTFYSKALGVNKSYYIYLPAGYDNSTARYPVVFFLRQHELEWFNGGGSGRIGGRTLKDVADTLMDKGYIGKMILVGTNTGSDDNQVYAGVNMLHPELTSSPGIGTGRFEDYFFQDLIPTIDSTFRTIPDRAHRGIDGFSLGGFASTILSIRNPQSFCSVGSYDGSLMWYNLDDPDIPGTGADDPLWFATWGDALFGPLFGLPRDSNYMLHFSVTNVLMAADSAKLDSIKSMRFHIHSSAFSGSVGNLSRNRQFVDSLEARGIFNTFPNFILSPDAIHTYGYADLHASMSLIKHWETFQSLPDIHDILFSKYAINIQCSPGQQGTSGLEFSNTSSRTITIDSIALNHTSVFSLNKNFAGQVFGPNTSDSIIVRFISQTIGLVNDTIKIFHNAFDITNPIKIPVTGIANTVPYLYKFIPTQTAPAGLLFTFQIPDSTFPDNDPGDSLTYQATGLPAWLSFDPQTRTFQGTPPPQTGLPISLPIGVTATDLLQASASTSFFLSIVRQSAHITFEMSAGWHLVSVPSLQSNYSADVLFPGKYGNMFAYNMTLQDYIPTSTLTNGRGYWVFYQVPDTFTTSGLIMDPLTITSSQGGWVIIGSRETDIPLSSLILSDGIILGSGFRYNIITCDYEETTVIRAGEGVWIYITKPCTITIP
jgi:enterochelin esterase-like enzyme